MSRLSTGEKVPDNALPLTLDDKLGKPNKDNYVLVKLKAKVQIIYYFGRIMTDIDDNHMKKKSSAIRYDT